MLFFLQPRCKHNSGVCVYRNKKQVPTIYPNNGGNVSKHIYRKALNLGRTLDVKTLTFLLLSCVTGHFYLTGGP